MAARPHVLGFSGVNVSGKNAKAITGCCNESSPCLFPLPGGGLSFKNDQIEWFSLACVAVPSQGLRGNESGSFRIDKARQF